MRPLRARLFLLVFYWVLAMDSIAQYVIELPMPERCMLPEGKYLERIFGGGGRWAGTVQRGPMNTSTDAELRPSVGEAIARLAACGERSASTPLAIRINRLAVEELSGVMPEQAVLYLNIDILQRRDTTWRIRYNVGGCFQTKGGMDATHSHGENIVDAFSRCLAAYASAESRGGLIDLPFDVDHSDRPISIKDLDLGILRAQDLPVGVFRDFQAFREGRVDALADTDLFSLRPDGTLKLAREIKDLRREIWGAYDGQTIHLRTGRRFVRVDHVGDRFVATVFRSVYTPEEKATMGFMFGLSGALATSAVEDVTVEIDLLTGQLLPLVRSGSDPSSVSHMIYYTRFTKSDAPITVIMGEERCQLEKDTYCEIRLKPDSPIARITLQGPAGAMDLEAVYSATRTGFTVVDQAKGKAPHRMKMNEQMENTIRERLKSPMLRQFAKP